jgi:hypothetical protein
MKKMKLILMTLLVSISLMSCSEFGDKVKNIIEPNTELYQITDEFVESLQTTYESYGILGGQDHTKYAKDGLYKVSPIGRLINVRIEKSVSGDEYETLKNDLKEHYKNDTHVNDVYICNAGTVMIDCRN